MPNEEPGQAKKTKMRRISFVDSPMSEEYRQLLVLAYRETAAVIIQRAFRRWQDQKKGVKHKPKIDTSIIRPKKLSAKVMQEPEDDKFREHAYKINDQKYTELDFNDPEFERNLFKALRLGFINKNQMIFALMLKQAQAFLHDYNNTAPQLQQFRFDDKKGPYQFSDTSDATEEQIKTFHACLKKEADITDQDPLKNEDQYYVIVNFSKAAEYYFFCGCTFKAYHSKKYQSLLETYLQKFNVLTKDEITTCLYNDGRYDRKAETILQKIPAPKENISGIDASSLAFLKAIIAEEQMPSLVLSPYHKKNKPNTPTIAVVVTTLQAQAVMSKIINEGNFSLPYPIAGNVTTREILAFDGAKDFFSQAPKAPSEQITQNKEDVKSVIKTLYPQQTLFAKPQATPLRPIEIRFRQDLSYEESVHGNDMHDFIVTFHDLFHAWRVGGSFNEAPRRARDLLMERGECQKSPVLMNAAIWQFSDLDLQKNGFGDSGFSVILEVFNKTKLSKDFYLLLFIDIVKNPGIWNSFIRDPDDQKEHANFEQYITHFARNNRLYGELLPSFFQDNDLFSLIHQHKEKSNESIILRYTLRKISGANALCDEIDAIGIDKFLSWGVNSGLFIKKEMSASGEKEMIDQLPAKELYEKLSACVDAYKTKNDSDHRPKLG